MVITPRRSVPAAFLLAVLGACTSGPEIQVASSGTMPVTGGYVVAEGAPGAVERLVSGRLAERGLVATEAPDYLVQVSYAERPAGTGLFLPDAEAREWLRTPELRRKRKVVATLGISIVETARGQEVYRASASGPAAASPDEADGNHLLDAILSAPPAETPAES